MIPNLFLNIWEPDDFFKPYSYKKKSVFVLLKSNKIKVHIFLKVLHIIPTFKVNLHSFKHLSHLSELKTITN